MLDQSCYYLVAQPLSQKDLLACRVRFRLSGHNLLGGISLDRESAAALRRGPGGTIQFRLPDPPPEAGWVMPDQQIQQMVDTYLSTVKRCECGQYVRAGYRHCNECCNRIYQQTHTNQVGDNPNLYPKYRGVEHRENTRETKWGR